MRIPTIMFHDQRTFPLSARGSAQRERGHHCRIPILADSALPLKVGYTTTRGVSMARTTQFVSHVDVPTPRRETVNCQESSRVPKAITSCGRRREIDFALVVPTA